MTTNRYANTWGWANFEFDRLTARERRLRLLRRAARLSPDQEIPAEIDLSAESYLWLDCDDMLRSTNPDIKWLVAKGYLHIRRDRPLSRSRVTKAYISASGFAALRSGKL